MSGADDAEEVLRAAHERWVKLQRLAECRPPPLQGEKTFQVGRIEFSVPARLEERCRRLAPIIEAWYDECLQSPAYETVNIVQYKINKRSLSALLRDPAFVLGFVIEKFVKKTPIIVSHPIAPAIDVSPAFNSAAEAEGYITATLWRLAYPEEAFV